MPRITVATLAGIVALTGLSLGCLLYASSPWAQIATIAYYAALVIAPLGIIYRTGLRRAFYIGFAIWAWGGLGLSFAPSTPTTLLLAWAHATLIPRERQREQPPRAIGIPVSSLKQTKSYRFESDEQMDVTTTDASIAIKGIRLRFDRPRPMQYPNRAIVPSMVLNGTVEQEALIAKAVSDKKQFTVAPHRPGLLSPLSASPPVDKDSFIRIGHSLLGLLLGLVGGLLGMRFYRTREG